MKQNNIFYLVHSKMPRLSIPYLEGGEGGHLEGGHLEVGERIQAVADNIVVEGSPEGAGHILAVAGHNLAVADSLGVVGVVAWHSPGGVGGVRRESTPDSSPAEGTPVVGEADSVEGVEPVEGAELAG